MGALNLRGVSTEMFTPLREDGSIDWSALERLVSFQISAGVRALFLHGVGTETIFMTADEQVELVRRTAAFAGGRLPVIANVIHPSLEHSLQLLECFEQAGADAVSLCPPGLLAYSEAGLSDYFETLMAHAGVPVCLYNMPQSQNTLSPSLTARLINENKNVFAYKDSTQNIIHLQSVAGQLTRQDVCLLAGSDATIFPTLALGGEGVVSFLSTVFPAPVKRICERYFAGDLAGARCAQYELLRLRDALKAAPNTAGYKYAGVLTGLMENDVVRPPLTRTDAAAAQRLRGSLQALGLL
ncbi:dihydrodipicolinate synthase family protein [Feifania hominis]|uniref:Dihydrodipicolinate synthase family protein n=1 Tax=Feifania hominis TaxID=2763660 RepID=A0A926DCI6_9FIRM|nr:dihydrodipicolinate synthase family protein [Feifania hominis]MBC8535357.1 dihydrodipicolinate synthase family protein [Feifania hominis]